MRKFARLAVSTELLSCLFFWACSSDVMAPVKPNPAAMLIFTGETSLGDKDKNPSTPFLRLAPDGRLFAVWTEDDDRALPKAQQATAHQHGSMMKRPPSPMRLALI